MTLMSLPFLISLEFETHIGLMESVCERYRGLAKDFTSQLIQEYVCSTSAEKALAEVIANAYIRILDNSQRLNGELECREITPVRNAYIGMLSKQVDRANRQFLNALMTLKQLKAPAIEISVRTQTAFIAQNQQVNVSKQNTENNESK